METNINYIWPQGKWKGTPIRQVPAGHLRYISITPSNPKNTWMIQWKIRAMDELKRRHSLDTNIRFSEHSIERFTQYWPRYLYWYRFFIDNQAGIITAMRNIFTASLSNGDVTKSTKTTEDSCVLYYKNYKWVYSYSEADNSEFYNIISIFNMKLDRT